MRFGPFSSEMEYRRRQKERRMILIFEGGPIDGDERVGEASEAPRQVLVESIRLVMADHKPAEARYELVVFEPTTKIARYMFRGWQSLTVS